MNSSVKQQLEERGFALDIDLSNQKASLFLYGTIVCLYSGQEQHEYYYPFEVWFEDWRDPFAETVTEKAFVRWIGGEQPPIFEMVPISDRPFRVGDRGETTRLHEQLAEILYKYFEDLALDTVIGLAHENRVIRTFAKRRLK